ncbi:MAG: hypothetical protein OIF58_00145 [Cohaesibacter sp.]|nr:hypothetical protein [Cohaesibacter sp.]MCV6574123.1 hypothetical protein [Cohaesibacter sp.]
MTYALDKVIQSAAQSIDQHRQAIEGCTMTRKTFFELECESIERGSGAPNLAHKSIYGIPVTIDESIPPSQIRFLMDGDIKTTITL